MGNSNPIELKHLTTVSHPERWKKIGATQTFEILRDSVTGEEVEQSYVHTGFNRSHEQQMAEYLFRNKHEGNIVRVIFADRVSSENFCVGSDKYIVRTERIPIRLATLQNLKCPQSLFILRQALIGFQSIYLYGKKATITDEMIGLTNQGDVKVWINSNFADNIPQSYGIEIRGKPLILTEPEIVQEIFMTVRQHTANKMFHPKLLGKTNDSMTFAQAIRAINTYAWEQNISLNSKVMTLKVNTNNFDQNLQKNDVLSTHPSHPSSLPSANSIKAHIEELPNTKRVQQLTPNKVQPKNQIITQRISPPPSRPVSTSGQKRQTHTIQIKTKLDESTKPTNGAINTVVNIQSKAIQLKQQTNPFDSKRLINYNGADSLKLAKTNPSPTKFFAVPREKNDQLSVSPTRDRIFIQNRQSPRFITSSSQRAHSTQQFIHERKIDKRGNQHFGVSSQHHIMQHKNRIPLMETSQHKNEANHRQLQDSSQKSIPFLTKSIDKREAQLQNKTQLHQKIMQKRQQSPKITINLQNCKSYKVNRPQNEQSRPSTEARILKPQFSFDPKYYSKPTVQLEMQSDQSQNTLWAGVPIASSITNSSPKNLITSKKFTQVSKTSRNHQNIIFNTRPHGGSRLDEEKVFLQDKIRQIEEQLKYITSLNSKTSTPARSKDSSIKGSNTNPEVVNNSNENQWIKVEIQGSKESDRVKTSNTSIQRLQGFKKNGFFKSKEQ